jgi:hypothetical protein
MKLVPNVAQVAASVDTHINVNVTEDEARQKLLSAFTALVESRRDDERATRGAGRRPLEQVTYTRVDEAETRAADPSARDPRRRMQHRRPPSMIHRYKITIHKIPKVKGPLLDGACAPDPQLQWCNQ